MAKLGWKWELEEGGRAVVIQGKKMFLTLSPPAVKTQ
jgi:hypothetical protein